MGVFGELIEFLLEAGYTVVEETRRFSNVNSQIILRKKNMDFLLTIERMMPFVEVKSLSSPEKQSLYEVPIIMCLVLNKPVSKEIVDFELVVGFVKTRLNEIETLFQFPNREAAEEQLTILKKRRLRLLIYGDESD